MEDLGTQRIGKAADRKLGAAVDRLKRHRAISERRTNIDDGPMIALAHPLERGHHAMNLAQIGHGGAARHFLGCQLGDRREDRRHGDIHPNIDRPQVALDLVGRRFDRIGVRHIRGDRQGAPAEAAQLGRRALQPVRIARQ